jgi:hypothetical protein
LQWSNCYTDDPVFVSAAQANIPAAAAIAPGMMGGGSLGLSPITQPSPPTSVALASSIAWQNTTGSDVILSVPITFPATGGTAVVARGSHGRTTSVGQVARPAVPGGFEDVLEFYVPYLWDLEVSLIPSLVIAKALTPTTNTAQASTGAIDATGGGVYTHALVVVAVAWYVPGSATNTVTDNSGANTYTALPAASTGESKIQLFYCQNAVLTDAMTWSTASNGGSYPTIAVLVLDYGTASGGDDVASENASSSANGAIRPGTMTPRHNNEILVTAAAAAPTNATFSSVDSGYAIIDSAGNFNPNVALAIAVKLQSAAAAINPTWAGSFTDAAAAQVAFPSSGAPARIGVPTFTSNATAQPV